MTVRDDLLTAIRRWIQLSVGFSDIEAGFASAAGVEVKVILARQDAPRPAKPYLTLLLTSLDERIGEDHEVESLTGAGAPQRQSRGARRARLSVNGYGDEAEDWLREAGLGLRRNDVGKALFEAGLGILVATPVTDISAVVDSGFEGRFLAEYEILYGVASAAEELLAVETVSTEAAIGDTDLSISISI